MTTDTKGPKKDLSFYLWLLVLVVISIYIYIKESFEKLRKKK